MKIIGGGITGLTIGYLMKKQGKDVTIYTDKVGGQMKLSKFSLGPRILDYNSDTEKFYKMIAEDAGITDSDVLKPQEFKIGYLTPSGISDDYTTSDYKSYLSKMNRSSDSTAMSSGQRSIIGWEMTSPINITDVMSTYLKDNLVVKKLSRDEIIKISKTEEVISTIPMVDRSMLVSYIGFYLNDERISSYLDNVINDSEYTYIYDMISDSIFKRHTLTTSGIVSEISTDDKNTVADALVTLPQVYSVDSPIHEFNGIKLEGRMATYDHSYKLRDTVGEYIEKNDCY